MPVSGVGGTVELPELGLPKIQDSRSERFDRNHPNERT